MSSPEFFTAVHCLRALPAEQRLLAVHAAMFWDDARLERTEQAAAVARKAVSLLADVLMAAAPNVILFADRRPCAS